MKPICHVNLARSFRGGERQTELLIRGLADLGVVQRLVFRSGAPLGGRVAGIAGLECVPVAGLASGLLSAIKATRNVALIHAHEGRGVYVGLVRNLLSRTPYVVTRRVSNSPSKGWFTRVAYRRAAAIVAVAKAVAEVMQQLDSALEPVVIHSALSGLQPDPDFIEKLKQRYPGKFIVGNIGALDNSTKGQVYLIRVARMLADSHSDIRFVLVGSGADEEWFRREAKGLDNLVFEGFVDNVADYLAWFDVFAFPSQIEGIGGILLDAMHSGLPVIATRVGGLAEIVHDGQNGLMIEPRDEGALRDAILQLYSDAALRDRLSDAGRQWAQGFSSERMVAEYKDVYDALLDKEKHNRG
jgi:glycosyltransferase involved in cell wall biosynthesis